MALQEERGFYCLYCPRNLSSRTNLRRHYCTVHRDRPLPLPNARLASAKSKVLCQYCRKQITIDTQDRHSKTLRCRQSRPNAAADDFCSALLPETVAALHEALDQHHALSALKEQNPSSRLHDEYLKFRKILKRCFDDVDTRDTCNGQPITYAQYKDMCANGLFDDFEHTPSVWYYYLVVSPTEAHELLSQHLVTIPILIPAALQETSAHANMNISIYLDVLRSRTQIDMHE
jgi:hypothetical protein